MGDLFGSFVSMNSYGNRIVAGAPGNDRNGKYSGHARVFEEKGNTWIQVGDNIDGEAKNNGFGFSVGMNSGGDRVIAGGWNNDGDGKNNGHVRIFEESYISYESSWTQVGNNIDREAARKSYGPRGNDFIGPRVSMNSDGNRFVVGARFGTG